MTEIRSALLWSDWLIYGLVFIVAGGIFYIRHREHLREPWRQVWRSRLGMSAIVVLIFYIIIGLLDSIHLQIIRAGQSEVVSILDLLLSPLGQITEKTYSAPFASHLLNKSLIILPDGREIQGYLPLKYGAAYFKNSVLTKAQGIFWHFFKGLLIGLISYLLILVAFIKNQARRSKTSWQTYANQLIKGKLMIAWREAIITFGTIWLIMWICICLADHYHLFGTDKIGQDVFYLTIKSIRTGLLIGTLTTLFMLPFALVLGTMAGYFRGWIDDVIQYIYITLSSIPGVLLISAVILVMQVYIANHPNLFPTLLKRADARLLALCLILGITSWATLCRLLRAETLKLRNLEFVQAAHALGVSQIKIILRHIVPNVMHIIMITLVLDFSGLVLAEAVLSYVGVGVDPITISWGNMINSSRLELAREPVVWWPLIAAFIFMFGLVLAANIFSDAVRDAFDPRLRTQRFP